MAHSNMLIARRNKRRNVDQKKQTHISFDRAWKAWLFPLCIVWVGILALQYFGVHASHARSNSTKAILISLLSKHIHSKSKSNQLTSFTIQHVPALLQYPSLPTGCEVTSLAMLLQWAGIHITPVGIADWIPKYPLPVGKHGNNPESGYIGSPFLTTGYGVYHKPVLQALDHFDTNRGKDLTGSKFSAILHTIASNRPVVAWVTIGLKSPKVIQSWITPHGKHIRWIAPEHTVTIIGFTPKTIIANDPETGRVIAYNRALFKKRWDEMGKQAITVISKK